MSQLLEEILSKDNMTQAYKKVKANKGTCGADGVGKIGRASCRERV